MENKQISPSSVLKPEENSSIKLYRRMNSSVVLMQYWIIRHIKIPDPPLPVRYSVTGWPITPGQSVMYFTHGHVFITPGQSVMYSCIHSTWAIPHVFMAIHCGELGCHFSSSRFSLSAASPTLPHT